MHPFKLKKKKNIFYKLGVTFTYEFNVKLPILKRVSKQKEIPTGNLKN